MQNTRPPRPQFDCEVAIVGAGPVGLLLANLLGDAGIRTLVLEKRADLPGSSQAIGITPPSLAILSKIRLAEKFVARGIPIRDVFVHGDQGLVGCCSFRRIPGDHPFVLSLPQRLSMSLLEEKLRSCDSVRLVRNAAVTGISPQEDHVTLQTNGIGGITAAFAVGCDGHRSAIRELMGVRTRAHTYACHFVMGDFTGHSGMGDDGHVFFTEEGAVESFPLPDGLRRWIVQTHSPMEWTPPEFISAMVRQRTGVNLDAGQQINQTWFTPKRLDCHAYVSSRAILCGDAAHVMSPIGGQGMNVGFADAAMLVDVLKQVLRRDGDVKALLSTYEKVRKREAAIAANRAAGGMWLGTRRGFFLSRARGVLMRGVLLGFMHDVVSEHYAMMHSP
ncbi:2-polyprenyl-6-methoxyphenol hydroxylase-like FAD-dependent oxidoreductase [Roseimicrobium gellanilyticum]|uniref:2-polyprenyl-6-methoxyphenol hydroxylase-like FAD-dependent oxidoreductase n=1 Tax=Roseimicrobium gellanilyticum TaxID=748857 RepID=A0A366H9M7_9BACT|nr:NAD(P)/FAD-dependent oxidoreductase [Roseimicrobium gellanilyticum]RBP38527.1 2-polyprenyl-6-methoxyphenol hydroxylase-like FAD-dependent oxidoreductase [Roseimicrobium gellanilyticum]